MKKQDRRIVRINDEYYPQYKGWFFWHNFEKQSGAGYYTVYFLYKEEAEEFLRTNPKRHNANVKVIEFKG